jgi:hypothetical protein
MILYDVTFVDGSRIVATQEELEELKREGMEFSLSTWISSFDEDALMDAMVVRV